MVLEGMTCEREDKGIQESGAPIWRRDLMSSWVSAEGPMDVH
jgi:hypothetical protein